MAERRAILILGQKKAGTTSLYSAIATTGLPLVDIPKESGVMDSPAMLGRVIERAPEGAVLLDATTTYFASGRFSDAFIANLGEFARITAIFICRAEETRLYSHFRHSSNYDGWKGSLDAFVASREYLNHARLGPPIEALRQVDIAEIHVLPFALLQDEQGLADAIETIVGVRPDLSQVAVENRFGSMLVMPGRVQGFLNSPLFQTVLRPLMPSGLRAMLKNAIGRSAREVDAESADDASIQEITTQIDGENAILLHRFALDNDRA